MKKFIEVFVFTLVTTVPVGFASTHNVDCDAGERLADSVALATSGDTINVTGYCNESLIIGVDNLTIDGQSSTVIDPATLGRPSTAVLVDGGRGVKLQNIEIQNGLNGVALRKGAHAALHDVILRDQSVMGVDVTEKSLLTVDSVAVSNASVHGLNIVEASNLKITGDLAVSGSRVFSLNLQDGSVLTAESALITLNNNTFGLHVSVGSTAFINESSVETNNNQLIGVAVDNGSKIFMFSSHLQANNNGLDGIDCNINSNIDFDAASSATANENGRNGISLEDTTFNVFSFFLVPGPSIEASNNAQNGVILTLGSKFDIGINSRFTALGNGANGVLVDDGSVAHLTDTTITGHGKKNKKNRRHGIGDLRVTFGSRASASGTTNIGRITCDRSALFRGALHCHPPHDG